MAESLDTAIKALQAEDTAQRTSLQQQKEALEGQIAALRQYVDQTIAANKDWTTATFATLEQVSALNTSVASLQESIAALAKDLSSIRKETIAKINQDLSNLATVVNGILTRLDALEAQVAEIIGMIQSVAVIPTYSDGSVGVSAEYGMDMHFEVRPLSVAEKLKDLPLSVFSLNAVYTQTKAGVEFIPLDIRSVSFDEGVMTLSVIGNQLSPDFYAGKMPASARLYIESGQTSIASAFFPLYPVSFAVDLGLSVKWATSNLCEGGLCAYPEDYGDYYAWGEVEPYYSSQEPLTWKDGKIGYNRTSYKWCSSDFSTLTKYNTSSDYGYGTVDNKTVLEMEDDAAHANLGGNWRMPTDAEWTELREQCTWTWTDNYNNTGIAGRIVTSNVEGYKDKSIFLPAAGSWRETYLAYSGDSGEYWSSSLNTYPPEHAYALFFDSDSVGTGHMYRYRGYSVRPVSE